MRDESRINRCYNDFGNPIVLLKTASKVLFRNLNCSHLYALAEYSQRSCSCSILNTVLVLRDKTFFHKSKSLYAFYSCSKLFCGAGGVRTLVQTMKQLALDRKSTRLNPVTSASR